MRDRDRLVALVAPYVHPGPEVLRVVGVEPRERDVRRLVAAEDDVAVQVLVEAAGARRGVLVGDERREDAGLVVAVRGPDDLAPGGTDDVLVELLAVARVGVLHESHVGLQGGEDAAPLLDGLGVADSLGGRVVVCRLVRVLHRRQHAEVVRVVRDALEIERPVELQFEPGRMLDRVPLGELVGLVRAGAGAEHESVVGVRRVDVQVAEEGLAVRGGCRWPRRRSRRGATEGSDGSSAAQPKARRTTGIRIGRANRCKEASPQALASRMVASVPMP